MNRKITLIVATIHRTDEVRRLFNSLRNQTIHDFSILLCDQNSDDRLVAVLNEFQRDLAITHIKILPTGVSSARNAGIQKIPPDTEILAFPDDDCFYEPDTLEQVCRYFENHADCKGILGIWGAPDSSLPDFTPTKVTRITAFKRGETYVQFFRVLPHVPPLEFDPLLGPGAGTPYGGGEDTDYLLRFMESVSPGVVMRVASVHLRHPEQIGNTTPEKLEQYAMGRMGVLKKHRYSTWFQLLTVLYPLAAILNESPKKWKYRIQMFVARMNAWIKLSRRNAAL